MVLEGLRVSLVRKEGKSLGGCRFFRGFDGLLEVFACLGSILLSGEPNAFEKDQVQK